MHAPYKTLADATPVTEDYRYSGKGTQVWYMKPEFFRDFSMGPKFLQAHRPDVALPTLDTLTDTHVLIGEVRAGVDAVWEMMQAENWSPNGEARSLIQSAGARHTSMSVGDIVKIGTSLYMIDGVGSKKIALRKAVIRLAHANLALRSHLLPLISKHAFEERGPGGLLFSYEGGFSFRTIPTDPPYNQTYHGIILSEMGPRGPYQAALAAVRDSKDTIMRMKTPHEVMEFVDKKVQESGKKPPKWNTYSSPD